MSVGLFLGRLHVLALHLPVAIVVIVVIVQWLGRTARYRHLAQVEPFLWGAAAISAVLTVGLGYLHFAEGGFDGSAGSAHRFYGTLTAVVTVLVAIATVRYPGVYRSLGRPAGVVAAVLITVTGHYGGTLTHGSTYLSAYAPGPLRSWLGAQAARPRITELGEADPFLDIVQPMLARRCGTCHNDEKRNGTFSMATYASTLAGGDTGRAIVPGSLDASELYYRVTRQPDAEEFMPAEGKTPLTDDEVSILAWWIEAGAPVETTIGRIGVDNALAALLAAELGLGSAAVSGETPPSVGENSALIGTLADAGFLVRPVSLDDRRLIVSVYSPGQPVGAPMLDALSSAGANIVELNLQDASLDDASLVALRGLTGLTRLRLSGNRLTDAGISALDGLTKLESLNLYGNAGITDAGLESLARFDALQRLYLWQTGVSEAGAERLRAQRPDMAVNLGSAETLSTLAH